jgi:hypothetical protein
MEAGRSAMQEVILAHIHVSRPACHLCRQPDAGEAGAGVVHTRRVEALQCGACTRAQIPVQGQAHRADARGRCSQQYRDAELQVSSHA